MKNSALSWILFFVICIVGIIAFVFFWIYCPWKFSTENISGQHKEKIDKRILVILSDHVTNTRTGKWVTIIDNWATNNPYFNIDLNIVELDVLRTPNAADWQKELDKVVPVIRQHRYDMILTLDNVALDLLVRPENQLPADIPVLFSGYEKKLDDLLKIHPNLTGIKENLNMIPNVELGLQLFPKTKEIIILIDASLDSQALLAEAQKNLSVPNGVKISFLSNHEKSIMNIYNVLRRKSEHSLLIFPPWREMATNDYQTRNAMAQDLARVIKFPFFISTDEVLNSGALGGYLVPTVQLAEKTADLATVILQKKQRKIYHLTLLPINITLTIPCYKNLVYKKKTFPQEVLLLVVPPDYGRIITV